MPPGPASFELLALKPVLKGAAPPSDHLFRPASPPKMTLRSFVLAASLLIAVLGHGQSLPDYLKIRRQQGISQAVGIPALEAFVGKRTLEIRGTVKGTFAANGRRVLMVDRGDGESIFVQAAEIPDWLTNGHVVARLLIRAEKDEEEGELRAWLIGAAEDYEIAEIERKEAERIAAANRAKAPKTPPSRPAHTSGKEWNLPAGEAVAYYAGFIKQRNRRLSDGEAWRIAQGIIGFSVMYGVDARLIMAMVMAESGFNPSATSRSGAMGLGQLMPGTARGMGLTNAYDTTQNLYATVRTVRGHLERYGKKTGDEFHALVLMLAAYNAGSGSVRKYQGIPPFKETQRYIQKVVAYYTAFCR